MSVTYFINRKMRVKDLKEKGYEIIDNRENVGQYPIVIKHKDAEDCWLGIGEWTTTINDDIDETEFYRLESHHRGIPLMFQMAEDFDIKFMDDEEFEILYYRENHNFNEEDEDKLFDERCEKYMNLFLNDDDE